MNKIEEKYRIDIEKLTQTIDSLAQDKGDLLTKLEESLQNLNELRNEYSEILNHLNTSETEKNKLIEKKELQMGILKKPIRIGKNRYEPKLPDFKLSSELSSNLRTLNPEGNITRDSFDNIFRKNLVEPGNPFGAKKRRTSVPKYKYHTTEKGFTQDSEDRTLGESFNIYQY